MNSLRDRLSPEGRAEQQTDAKQRSLRLATAGILLEIAYADQSFSMAEEKNLSGYLKSAFDLTDEEARDLIESADQLRTRTIDHFALTNMVRKNTTHQERIEIVKTMWRLVYVDGNLHQYEGYLVRKLSDLLGVDHPQMIEAKLAVQDENRG
ncbi:MAG: TerB family tellurite resistance protein [Thermoanaerobaculia bacterium]